MTFRLLCVGGWLGAGVVWMFEEGDMLDAIMRRGGYFGKSRQI